MVYTNLKAGRAKKVNDMCIEIEFPGELTSFAKSVLEQQENKEEISKLISLEEGQKMHIKYVEKPKKNIVPEDIGIEINVIDA